VIPPPFLHLFHSLIFLHISNNFYFMLDICSATLLYVWILLSLLSFKFCSARQLISSNSQPIQACFQILLGWPGVVLTLGIYYPCS
jgi:hypothetical protein